MSSTKEMSGDASQRRGLREGLRVVVVGDVGLGVHAEHSGVDGVEEDNAGEGSPRKVNFVGAQADPTKAEQLPRTPRVLLREDCRFHVFFVKRCFSIF